MLIVRGANPQFTTRYLRLSVIFCKQLNLECKLCQFYSYHVPQDVERECIVGDGGGGSGEITHSTHGELVILMVVLVSYLCSILGSVFFAT